MGEPLAEHGLPRHRPPQRRQFGEAQSGGKHMPGQRSDLEAVIAGRHNREQKRPGGRRATDQRGRSRASPVQPENHGRTAADRIDQADLHTGHGLIGGTVKHHARPQNSQDERGRSRTVAHRVRRNRHGRPG